MALYSTTLDLPDPTSPDPIKLDLTSPNATSPDPTWPHLTPLDLTWSNTTWPNWISHLDSRICQTSPISQVNFCKQLQVLWCNEICQSFLLLTYPVNREIQLSPKDRLLGNNVPKFTNSRQPSGKTTHVSRTVTWKKEQNTMSQTTAILGLWQYKSHSIGLD